MLQYITIPNAFVGLIQSLDFDAERVILLIVLGLDDVIAFVQELVTVMKWKFLTHEACSDTAILHIKNCNVKILGIAFIGVHFVARVLRCHHEKLFVIHQRIAVIECVRPEISVIALAVNEHGIPKIEREAFLAIDSLAINLVMKNRIHNRQ